MVINPLRIIDEKILTSPDIEFNDQQIQPNGIDLRIKSIREIPIRVTFQMSKNVKSWESASKQEVERNKFDHAFKFHPMVPYEVECYEYVNIPAGMCALIITRSTLNRNGLLARASLYDSGFINYVGFTIYPFVNAEIRPETRVAQIIFLQSENAHLYNGQYQDLV